jgi:indole-3-glycerol phosphate synthase
MRFADALSDPGFGAVAEFKRRSPSAGDIRPGARIEDTVPGYETAGARAISVLVDPAFAGSLDDLRAARAATSLPLLAKGFFSTEEHLREVREAGADAALLILRDLDDAAAARLLAEAERLGLDTLVEAHDEDELGRATDLDAQVIGINARDLGTFRIDRGAQLRLVAKAPRDRLVLAESAIQTRAQAAAAELAGADAVLVGTTLMRASDPGAKLEELLARPLVKVCGLTRHEDVDASVEAGADMCGFIFAAGSPRKAADVLPVPETVLSVAVFVGEPEERGADLVQLYERDATPSCSETASRLRAWPIFRGRTRIPTTGVTRAATAASCSRAVWGRTTFERRFMPCSRGRWTRHRYSSPLPASRTTKRCGRSCRRRDELRRVRRPLRPRDAHPGARRARAGLARSPRRRLVPA